MSSGQQVGKPSNIVNANALLVTATGSTTARTMADMWADTVNVLGFIPNNLHASIKAGTNSTDLTVYIQAALDYLTGAAGAGLGGTLFFPGGVYLVNGQLVFKNSGGANPTQPNIKLLGVGAHFSGQGTTPASGTILDLRSATAPAKIVTLGLGTLESTGITYATLGGTDSNAFILTTGTTLLPHRNSFWGNKAGVLADQDAIILGGPTITQDGTTNAPFQGYGTVISENYFNRIRRGVYGRVYANAVVIRDNTWWNACGSNLAGGAAVEFDSGADVNAGNVIIGNLFEVGHYPYAVKFRISASKNSVLHNNLYDPTATTIAAVRWDTAVTCASNIVVSGYTPGTILQVSDANGFGTSNQLITTEQSIANLMGSGAPTDYLGGVRHVLASGGNFGLFKANTGALEEYHQRISVNAGNVSATFYGQPDGGAEDLLLTLHNYGAGQKGVWIPGATFAALEFPDGAGLVRAKTGSSLKLGDQGSQNLTWQESTKTLAVTGTGATITVGSRALLPGDVGNILVTYSASMTIDASLGKFYQINASNSTAFTLNAPTNGVDGKEFIIGIFNITAGALGAATWNGAFHMAAWTQPGPGKFISAPFTRVSGAYYQTGAFSPEVAY